MKGLYGLYAIIPNFTSWKAGREKGGGVHPRRGSKLAAWWKGGPDAQSLPAPQCSKNRVLCFAAAIA